MYFKTLECKLTYPYLRFSFLLENMIELVYYSKRCNVMGGVDRTSIVSCEILARTEGNSESEISDS